jgi:AhpD family alkylhydroperoxidase
MKPRLNPYQAAPEAMKAVAALDTYVQGSGLEPSLVELIKMRASQINGCAYCLHMHSRDARAKGETEERQRRRWSSSPSRSAFARFIRYPGRTRP